MGLSRTTKEQLREKIKRSLGYPTVKVELEDVSIDDTIDLSRDMFLKWADGQASHRVSFTRLLSGGVINYDMPGGVLDVVSVNFGSVNSTSGSINTLFTLNVAQDARAQKNNIYWI